MGSAWVMSGMYCNCPALGTRSNICCAEICYHADKKTRQQGSCVVSQAVMQCCWHTGTGQSSTFCDSMACTRCRRSHAAWAEGFGTFDECLIFKPGPMCCILRDLRGFGLFKLQLRECVFWFLIHLSTALQKCRKEKHTRAYLQTADGTPSTF